MTNTLLNTYPVKNLRFLVEFFDALAITPHAYAKLTNNPVSEAQNLRNQLHKDDMKLSKAKRIVNTFGYSLSVSLMEKSNENIVIDDGGYVISLPPKVMQNREESPCINLAFLWSFMVRNRITKRALARDLDLSPGAVFTWFHADDIAISYLNTIREKYDAKLVFKILTE